MRRSGNLKRGLAGLLVFLIVVSFFVIMPVLTVDNTADNEYGENVSSADSRNTTALSNGGTEKSDVNKTSKSPAERGGIAGAAITGGAGGGFTGEAGVCDKPGSNTSSPCEPLRVPEFPAEAVFVMVTGVIPGVLIFTLEKQPAG